MRSHGTAQAGRTTRHGWHGTVEMQARHGKGNTGTALRPGTAGTARADNLAQHGKARHGRAQPCLADAEAKGAKPLACTTNPYLRPEGRLIWPMPARHGTARNTLARM